MSLKLIELGTASATPPLYVSIYNLCHRLGILEGEHIGAATPGLKIATWQCKGNLNENVES